MRILGIDPSMTSTGLAVIDHGVAGTRASTFRIESKPPKRAKGDKAKPTVLERHARLDHLARRVTDIACITPMVSPVLAVVEEPTYGTGREAGTWDRAGVWWLIVSRLMRLGVPVVQVNSTTRRLWATGQAAADKGQVSVHVSRLWPDVDLGICEDEWDALALGSMGAQHLGALPVELVRHREQLAKVTWPAFIEGTEEAA